jgi:hypothetical protein
MISLKKVGEMPMPIDLTVELRDGTVMNYYIPLRMMRGEKSGDIFSGQQVPDWPWTHADYTIEVDKPISEISKVMIDASGRLADVDIDNNVWPQEAEMKN